MKNKEQPIYVPPTLSECEAFINGVGLARPGETRDHLKERNK